MKHYRLRYSIDKVPALSEFERIIGTIWAVSDHQTGKQLAKNISYDDAHRLIDKLTGEQTSELSDVDWDDMEPAPGWRHRSNVRSGMYGRG